jgi:hypothetical protein
MREYTEGRKDPAGPVGRLHVVDAR